MAILLSVKRNVLGVAGIILGVVLFLSLNILASATLRTARLDLTEDKLYTLSDGTREVLRSIEEPITLRFFLSEQLAEQSPMHANFASRVRELLEHLTTLAGGMLKLETFAPEPYSVEEDRAMAYGLKAVAIGGAGGQAYFGLVATNSTDDQTAIQFFDPQRERFLEYDLTNLIYDLTNKEKTVIGLLSSLPLGMDPDRNFRPWPIFDQISQFFVIRSLRSDEAAIDEDVTVLLIVHPQALSEQKLYDIDQFVLRGGKVLVFVDPHSETAYAREKIRQQKNRQVAGMMPVSPDVAVSDLGKLFDVWGVEFSTEEVIGDYGAAQKVNVSGPRVQVMDYILWPALGVENLNREDVVTGQISHLNMASPGYLKAKEGATTELIPLITSTPRSMRIYADAIRNVTDPDILLKAFVSEDERFILAARLRGKTKSAFPEPPSYIEDTSAHLTEAKEPINIIVVADVDLLEDSFWLRFQNFLGRQIGIPFANNADFVINALDNLSGSNALISLRSRGLSFRPFHRIEEIRRDAESRYRETEKELTAKLRQTQEKLQALKVGPESGAIVAMAEEQKTAVANFNRELLSIRTQLREVQHALRKDIESLDTWLKAANIWAIPVLFGILAIVLALVRRARFKQRTAIS